MENFTSKVMTGLSVVAAAMDFRKDPTMAAFLIQGRYDTELSVALFYQKFGFTKENATEEDIKTNPAVIEALERVKNWIRNALVDAIMVESREIEMLKRINFQELVAQQKESHKPHIQGTVAEIAAKYKISKSEVRRLKADGKLDEFIQQHSHA